MLVHDHPKWKEKICQKTGVKTRPERETKRRNRESNKRKNGTHTMTRDAGGRDEDKMKVGGCRWMKRRRRKSVIGRAFSWAAAKQNHACQPTDQESKVELKTRAELHGFGSGRLWIDSTSLSTDSELAQPALEAGPEPKPHAPRTSDSGHSNLKPISDSASHASRLTCRVVSFERNSHRVSIYPPDCLRVDCPSRSLSTARPSSLCFRT
ncbi:hypothetical protein B0H10DRAFT_509402 [Mycena sp. CBHHK59/15]|nr:hypothetical protein B0H10DRAFT_509402 [Mycena sp. CBHHK59/15]